MRFRDILFHIWLVQPIVNQDTFALQWNIRVTWHEMGFVKNHQKSVFGHIIVLNVHFELQEEMSERVIFSNDDEFLELCFWSNGAMVTI